MKKHTCVSLYPRDQRSLRKLVAQVLAECVHRPLCSCGLPSTKGLGGAGGHPCVGSQPGTSQAAVVRHSVSRLRPSGAPSFSLASVLGLGVRGFPSTKRTLPVFSASSAGTDQSRWGWLRPLHTGSLSAARQGQDWELDVTGPSGSQAGLPLTEPPPPAPPLPLLCFNFCLSLPLLPLSLFFLVPAI